MVQDGVPCAKNGGVSAGILPCLLGYGSFLVPGLPYSNNLTKGGITMMSPIKDVTQLPDDEPDIPMSTGEVQEPISESKPKSKSWIDKARDLIASDDGVSRMRKEKQKSAEAEAQKQAALDREIAVREQDIARAAREADPEVKKANKQSILIHKARLKEAKILTAIYRAGIESLRRKAIPDNDPDVQYFMAQLDRRDLTGSIFSDPKKKG